MRERDVLQGKRVVVNLSGRGDKDLGTIMALRGGSAADGADASEVVA